MIVSEVNWTPAQRDAIYARGGTVLVSAAAGSGKTAVLVKRVIERLTDENDPCSVDELLIVTFTRAAALQMKNKISGELSKIISAEEDIKRKSRLLRQQMLLKCAKISTIDSFCGDVVRQNTQAIPLDSDYKLLDESGIRSIMDSAYEETAEEFYDEGSADFLVLADMFTKSNDDKLLKELVYSLYDFASSYMNPKKWIEEIDRRLGCEKTDFTNDFAVTVIDSFREDILYCKALAERGCGVLKSDEVSCEVYSPAFISDIEFFDKLLKEMPKKFTEQNWDKIIELTLSNPFVKLNTLKSSLKCTSSENAKAIRDFYKALYKKSVSSIGISSKDNRCDVEKLSPVVKMLSRFTLEFFDRFEKMKIEKNCADFSDVLHMALDLLVLEEDGKLIKTPLAQEYSKQFKEILIDEYQDTNEAQDILFDAVSRNGENLFFVGDVKQSIYGFRKATPQIFLDKRKTFTDYDRKNPFFPSTITLDSNFRSRKEITEFVNFIFCGLMSEGAGDIEYDERETLKAGASYPETDDTCCEMHIIESSAFEDVEPSKAQAVHIASEIKSICEDGRFKFGDVAILLRTNKSIPLFVQTLNDMGINAHADESENLFETEEVRTLFSLIKVIDNPVRDVPLLAVMMSPIFAFSADELAKIRINCKSGSFYSAVAFCAENGDEKCKKFLDMLSSFRLVSQTVTPGELVRHVLRKTGYKAIVSSWDRGAGRRENLDIFRAFADNFSSENEVGLSGFVRQLEKIEKTVSVKSSQASSDNENSVSVMTIHRSKGLEFPVCFLAETEKEFNRRSLSNDLLSHPKSGVGIVGIDTKRMIKYETLSRIAVKTDKEKTELSEDMRVLYVAMTRAKEKLVIVGSPKDFSKTLAKASIISFGEKINPVAVRRSSNYLEWLCAVAVGHPDSDSLRFKAGFSDVRKAPADFKLKIKLVDSLPKCTSTAETEEKTGKADLNYLSKIKSDIGYVYPFAALSDVLAKRGASTAFDKTVDREFFASERPAFLNKTSLTAAGRGTAMHSFMQFCDYEKAKTDLISEIARLKDKGFLSEIQANSLDIKKLERFFSSPLFERILKSEKVYREKKFIIGMSPCEFDESLPKKFAEEKVVVQGILDCAFEEDDEIVIVDYKTDRVTDSQVLKDRYCGQLEIYKRAVKECMGKNVKEALLYSFYLETTVQI